MATSLRIDLASIYGLRRLILVALRCKIKDVHNLSSVQRAMMSEDLEVELALRFLHGHHMASSWSSSSNCNSNVFEGSKYLDISPYANFMYQVAACYM